MKTYFVDDQFVGSDKAVIPVDDLAVLRGYGICDIMRTINKKPYLMEEHIQRLIHSASEIGLALPWSEKELIDIVKKTLEKNTIDYEANIRIIITGGSSTDYFTPQGHPRLIVMITDLKPLPEEWYTLGVKVITHYQERNIPDAKVTSYIPAAIAMRKAKQTGAVEAIYVNRDNFVLEGTTSNLFVVISNEIVTPKTGVLKGTTRQAVISLAKKNNPVSEKPIHLTTLLKADEIFITGTNKGIVPVVKVDNTKIGDGKPGKITLDILNRFKTQSLQAGKP